MRRIESIVGLALLIGIGGIGLYASPSQPASAQIKDETLKKTLENMGYEITETKSTDNRPIYGFTWSTDDGWKFVASASTSSNGKYAWIVMTLGKTDDAKKVPQEAALALLAENDNVLPMSYSWDPKGLRFYFNCPIDARDFSAPTVRKSIDSMVASVKRTGDSWDPGRWKK